jgi:hypothetical protein
LTESAEVAELRRRLDEAEREQAARAAEANAAVAAAQDRSYWLDRWQFDLNAFMRTPAGGLLREAARALRGVYRLLRR